MDIIALGPNLYLWLKNTAKICILICTPNAGYSDCRCRTEKSTYFGILHRLEPRGFTQQSAPLQQLPTVDDQPMRENGKTRSSNPSGNWQ